MNSAPRSVRPHIALLGRCNVGKSTLINALCGQNIALVSPVSGTTTDPVYKSMELLPFGPVVLVDTAGLDDNSILGRARIKLTARALRKAELALLVVDSITLLPIEQETLTDLCRRQEGRTGPLGRGQYPFVAHRTRNLDRSLPASNSLPSGF